MPDGRRRDLERDDGEVDRLPRLRLEDLNTIHGEWRYRPYNVNGKAVPVCTAVTFIYSQR